MIKINKIAVAILKTLQTKNDYVSGAKLSSHLGVTRNAIWKQITNLRERGYIIEAKPRYGYKLISSPAIPDAIGLAAVLNNKLIGTNIITIDETASTNDLAKDYAKKGADEGLVIIAKKQTMGRGRRGREWHSNTNGLYCSIMLRPKISLNQAAKITLLTGVAVVETLREYYDVDAMLKWPNDVLIDNRKICGILTELSADPEEIKYLVIGIGLNTNQTLDQWPAEIHQIATSLKIATGKTIDLQVIINQLFRKFEDHYLNFITRQDYDVISIAKRYSVLLGKEITVTPNNQEPYLAKALDLDENGALIIEKQDGTQHSLWAADVSVRNNLK